MGWKQGWVLGTVLMGILLAAPGRAEVAIAAKAGSLGLGAELTAGLSPQWNVRLGANGFTAPWRLFASFNVKSLVIAFS